MAHHDEENPTAGSVRDHHFSLKNLFITLSSLLISSLFITGALASAMKGFFSINSFILSLGAIPGLSLLHAIPYAFVLISAAVMFVYTLSVEQLIYKPHFEILIKQALGLTDIPTKNMEAKDKLKELKSIEKRIERLEKKQLWDEAQKVKPKLNKQPSNAAYKFIAKIAHKAHLTFGYTFAGAVVSLRALVSIGSTMLGVKILLLLLLSPFGFSALPVALTPICALVAAIGYFINSSQNLLDQFNQTMSFLGIRRYTRQDLKKINKDLKIKEKQLYRLTLQKQNTDIHSPNSSQSYHSTPTLSTENNQANSQSKTQSKIKLWQTVIGSIMGVGFYLGAIGASMQGFFSIDKFFSQMGEAISILNSIPNPLIFGLATVISLYTFFVEQTILKSYFCDLVSNWLGFNSTHPNEASKSKALQIRDFLPETRTTIINHYLSDVNSREYNLDSKNNTIQFYTYNAYKIYRLNEKIDAIHNHSSIKDLGITRTSSDGNNNSTNLNNSLIKLPKAISTSSSYQSAAKVGTIVILLLRAITSIGPSILGLAKAMTLAAGLFGAANLLGPWIYAPSILMASFGYFIKCSQNICNHYNLTLSNMFFINIEKSYEEKQSDRITDLKTEYQNTIKLFLKHNKKALSSDNRCAVKQQKYATTKPLYTLRHNHYHEIKEQQFIENTLFQEAAIANTP